jgi:adenylate kinase
VPEPVLISRLAGRRLCGQCNANYHVVNIPPKVDGICDACGGTLNQREDDRPERVANRLVVYREQTAALIDWYASRGLLVRVDADGDADETTARVAQTVMA